VVRLSMFRDSQNPAGLQVLPAGLSLADEPVRLGDLQVSEEPESAAVGPGSATYPERSAASSSALRGAVPLWVEEAASCARVAESQSDSRVPWVQQIELRAAPISGSEEAAAPSVRQPGDAAQPVLTAEVARQSLPVAQAEPVLQSEEPWARQLSLL